MGQFKAIRFLVYVSVLSQTGSAINWMGSVGMEAFSEGCASSPAMDSSHRQWAYTLSKYEREQNLCSKRGIQNRKGLNISVNCPKTRGLKDYKAVCVKLNGTMCEFNTTYKIPLKKNSSQFYEVAHVFPYCVGLKCTPHDVEGLKTAVAAALNKKSAKTAGSYNVLLKCPDIVANPGTAPLNPVVVPKPTPKDPPTVADSESKKIPTDGTGDDLIVDGSDRVSSDENDQEKEDDAPAPTEVAVDPTDVAAISNEVVAGSGRGKAAKHVTWVGVSVLGATVSVLALIWFRRSRRGILPSLGTPTGGFSRDSKEFPQGWDMDLPSTAAGEIETPPSAGDSLGNMNFGTEGLDFNGGDY
eukprot:202977_1